MAPVSMDVMARAVVTGMFCEAVTVVTAAALIRATADSGPMLRRGFLPRIMYTIRGMAARDSPAAAPTPASCPYAIAWGMK